MEDAWLKPASRVCTFGFTLGPQLITALSEGRGYGEAGGEGFFSSSKINPSPTRQLTGPPPASRRGLWSTDISCSDQNVQTPVPC